MDDESVELKERISQMADGELLRIVGPDRDDYVEEAIEYAMRELRVRNIPFEAPPPSAPRVVAFEEDAEGDESEEAPANTLPPCDVCRGAMRSGSLLASEEMTIVFHDTEEERFVQVLACSVCGKVNLVVDFVTDVERQDQD